MTLPGPHDVYVEPSASEVLARTEESIAKLDIRLRDLHKAWLDMHDRVTRIATQLDLLSDAFDQQPF